MTKTRKILLFSVAGVVLLLVIAAVVLPFLVDVNSFRPTIETAASGALGRPVRLGEMSLRVFPSIAVTVQNPVVGAREDEGGGDLITAAGLDVGARLMPLLRGRLEITDIVLKEPRVEVRRLADGGWNLARLAAGAPGGGDDASTGPPPLALESLSIRNARLVVHDIGWPEDDSVLEGVLSANLSVTGNLGGDMQVNGDLSLGSTLPLSAARGGPMPVQLDARFGLAVSDAGGRVEVSPLNIDIDGNTLQGRAVLEPAAASPVAEAVLEAATFDVAWLSRALAALGSDLPLTFSSPDSLNASGRLGRGARGAATVQARVEVSSFTFQHASMAAPAEDVRGVLEVGDDRLSITGFAARIGTSDVAGELAVQGFDAPQVRFDLKSNEADFWELFSFVAGDTETAPSAGGAPAPAGNPALDKLKADGTLAIASGRFGTLDFTGLSAGLSLAGDVLRLDPFRMALYDGTFEGTARIDVSGDTPSFAIDTRLAGIDSDALLTDNLDLAGTLAGRLGAQMKAAGRGADYETIVRSLTGGGAIEVTDGRLGKLEVLEMLTKASGVFGEQSVERLSRQLESEGTAFSVLRSDLKISGKQVQTQPLRMETPEFVLTGNGTLDLLTTVVNAKVGIVFSEEISNTMRAEKSRAADVFWDSKLARVHLPLTMTGPAEEPTPGIDWGSAAGQVARRKVEETVRSKLGKYLGEEPATPAPATPAGATEGTAPATAPSGPGPGATAAGAEARITEVDWGGNFLKPDLKIAGTVRGPVQAAAWEVTDSKGTLIESSAIALADGADLAAGLPFSFRVKGEKLILAKKPFTVTIRVTDTGGEIAEATTTARR